MAESNRMCPKKSSVWSFFRCHFAFISYIRKYCKCLFGKCIQTHAHTPFYLHTQPNTQKDRFFHWFVCLSLLAVVVVVVIVRDLFLCLYADADAQIWFGWFINDCLFFRPTHPYYCHVLISSETTTTHTHTPHRRETMIPEGIILLHILVYKKWSLTHFRSLEHVQVFKCYFAMRIGELTCLYAQMHT